MPEDVEAVEAAEDDAPDSPGNADDAAAADAVRERRARKGRRAARKAEASGSASGSDGGPPVTEAAALGLPEAHRVGGGGGGAPGLRLMLRAPVLADADRVNAQILREWPDVLIAAALTDPDGTGVDFERAAAFTRALAELNPEVGGALAAYGAADAEADFRAMARRFRAYGAGGADAEAGGEHVLSGVCRTLEALAVPYTEGLTPEALPGLLAANLRPADLADLLRAVMRCLDGCDTAYPGGTRDRFTGPSAS